MKCAHFRDSENRTTLKSYKMIGFTRGLHSMHAENVPRRLKAVFFSSGIRGLWRKWKNLRQTIQESRHSRAVEAESSYLPLSSNGSDVHVLFELFGLFVTASMVLFISGLGFKCFTVKILTLVIGIV